MILYLVLGLIAQFAILSQAWQQNPLARLPENDALVYWDWARDIATGKFVADTPFLSAPLYPYVLGLLRALGAGLLVVYAFQALLHLATAVLIGMTAQRHLGESVALVAVALWLLMLEPSFSTGRVLNSSLQLALTAWTMERWSCLTLELSRRRLIQFGLVLGLTTLAHPPLLVSLPLVAVGLWRLLDTGAKGAALSLSCSAAVILLATAHNLAACGELIPISAQAGVTFSHGNNERATGVYSAAEGVSASRTQQNLDAHDRARAVLGKDTGWKETDSFFFGEGLAWWRAEPGYALATMGKKLWYFVSGQNYGDIYVPALERESGLSSRLILAPIRSAWIILPGIIGLILLARTHRASFTGPALLMLIPLLVVAVFWYSPRYRLPALPPLVLGTAWLCLQLRTQGARRFIAGGALLVALLTGPFNQLIGFDLRASLRAPFQYQVGSLYLQEANFTQAREHLTHARDQGHPLAAIALGDLARREGGAASALDELRTALAAAPDDVYAIRSLATALAESSRMTGDPGQLAEALDLFRKVVERDRNDWRAVMGLANVLLSSGEIDEAIDTYSRAAEIAPTAFEVQFNFGVALEAANRAPEAIDAYGAALAIDSSQHSARMQLVALCVRQHLHARAIALLRTGLELSAGHPQMIQALAFHLASAPRSEDRNGREALTLMADFVATDEITRAVKLETTALILAELGNFQQASDSNAEAARKLDALGEAAWAAELRKRDALFQAGKPFRQAD